MNGDKVNFEFDGYIIFESFLISAISSFALVSLVECRNRCIQHKLLKQKKILLILMGIVLGSCSIFSMHFIGMEAMKLKIQGQTLEIKYDVGLTFVSFICAILSVYAGLYIASRDRFYNAENPVEKLLSDMSNLSIQEAGSKNKAILHALIYGIKYIIIGGIVSAGGVCIMHYLGMVAQQYDAELSFKPGIVALSVTIAVVAAPTAFFIIFRLLLWKHNASHADFFRVLASIILSLAVNCMHYTGMMSAKYESKANNNQSDWSIDGDVLYKFSLYYVLIICSFSYYYIIKTSRVLIRKEIELSVKSNNYLYTQDGSIQEYSSKQPSPNKNGRKNLNKNSFGSFSSKLITPINESPQEHEHENENENEKKKKKKKKNKNKNDAESKENTTEMKENNVEAKGLEIV